MVKQRVLHQFIIGASPGDAITDQALLLQRWLREDGFSSKIYAESIHPSLSEIIKPYDRYRPSQTGELVILHHSIGSDLVDFLLNMDLHLIVIYHNVTPPSFVQAIDPVLAVHLQKGREQLAVLKERTVLALGDSAFNEAELRQAGFSQTGILPIVLDPADYDLEPNPALLREYQEENVKLLFVGRLIANKRQEDLIKLLYFCRRVDPKARLFLVGSPWMPAYAEWLRELVEELNLGGAVIFAGHVSQRDLVTYYRLADVYVSMSEHEGFGKPLVESMYLGVPVVAYAGAAVPETLGGAGVLVRHKDFEALAELIDIVAKHPILRQRIIARQRERAQAFLPMQVRQAWEVLLQNFFKE